MPDRRTHRGPHPDDRRLFSAAALTALRETADDYRWLLNRGYAKTSALKLVGDRYELTKRQRLAIARSVCSDAALQQRGERQLDERQIAGQTLLIDGFNLLVTVETALGNGAVLHCRDGCWRDMASMHGTYRKVAETEAALRLIGQTCQSLGIVQCRWYLDRPVSNSGRLKTLMLQLSSQQGWPWEVELAPDPDRKLIAAVESIATADSGVLDRCKNWFNLARTVIAEHIPDAWIVDFIAG